MVVLSIFAGMGVPEALYKGLDEDDTEARSARGCRHLVQRRKRVLDRIRQRDRAKETTSGSYLPFTFTR